MLGGKSLLLFLLHLLLHSLSNASFKWLFPPKALYIRQILVHSLIPFVFNKLSTKPFNSLLMFLYVFQPHRLASLFPDLFQSVLYMLLLFEFLTLELLVENYIEWHLFLFDFFSEDKVWVFAIKRSKRFLLQLSFPLIIFDSFLYLLPPVFNRSLSLLSYL